MCWFLSIIKNNYIYSLQLHVSTHMSHLQARTISVYNVTVVILGSQTLTCILHRCYLLYYNCKL